MFSYTCTNWVPPFLPQQASSASFSPKSHSLRLKPSHLFCHHQILLSLPHKSLVSPILSSPYAPASALCNMQCTNCYSSCSLFPSSFILYLSTKPTLSSRQLSCSKNLQKFLTFQSDTLGLRTSGSSLISYNCFLLTNESLSGHGYLFSVPSAPLILTAKKSIMLKATETEAIMLETKEVEFRFLAHPNFKNNPTETRDRYFYLLLIS